MVCRTYYRYWPARLKNKGGPTTFMFKSVSDGFEFRVTHHQPLAALGKVYLHPCLGAGAFEVEDHPFAEDRVFDQLAKAERVSGISEPANMLLEFCCWPPPNGRLTLLDRRTSWIRPFGTSRTKRDTLL